ncbi:MAG: carboxypeptidase regulatory-like domain-containing protein [bacterium]
MPNVIRILSVAIVTAVAAPQLANAQSRGAPGPAPVPVQGVAFNGLRGEPLRNALITLVGSDQNTRTDAKGRFHFDSVTPGSHTFAMQHAALDSLGFTGLQTRALITSGRDEIKISVPTFATLWHLACGTSRPPEDSGFVYGTVRDADGGRPLAHATIDVAWTEMMLRGKRGVVERTWHTAALSDSTGSYAVCGVSANEWIRVRAVVDSSASGWINMAPSGLRVQRRDLLVAGGTSGSSLRGTVTGIITDAAGDPFDDARVVVDGLPEVRSRTDGTFSIANVPVGTRQLEVSSVGIAPVTTVVDIRARDTTAVAVSMGMPIVLDGVKIVGARVGNVFAAEFTMRRRSGMGYTMDSTQIGAFRTIFSAIQTAPSTTAKFDRNVLSISMPGARGGTCAPQVRIDGLQAEFGHLIDLQPSEVAAMEVYVRPVLLPAQFYTGGAPPTCGMILVWTKYGFRVR